MNQFKNMIFFKIRHFSKEIKILAVPLFFILLESYADCYLSEQKTSFSEFVIRLIAFYEAKLLQAFQNIKWRSNKVLNVIIVQKTHTKSSVGQHGPSTKAKAGSGAMEE